MASLNKIILIGFLGKDPEVRYLANGDAVANFSVATSQSWKDSAGVKQERTEWHRIVLYRKLAEIAEKYLKKGSQVYIEGRIETQKWQDKEGQERQTVQVVGSELKMFGGSSGNTQGDKPASQQASKPHPASSSNDMLDDDIPF